MRLRCEAEGLCDAEEACGAAFVSFSFDGEVGRWGGAMKSGAPSETGAAEGGIEGSVVEVPGIAVAVAFEEPGLGAGRIGGGREDEEELVAGGRDVTGE